MIKLKYFRSELNTQKLLKLIALYFDFEFKEKNSKQNIN